MDPSTSTLRHRYVRCGADGHGVWSASTSGCRTQPADIPPYFSHVPDSLQRSHFTLLESGFKLAGRDDMRGPTPAPARIPTTPPRPQRIMIDIRTHRVGDVRAIEDLVASVFTESDGEEEGARVGTLAGGLMATTAPDDLVGFVAVDGEEIIAAIFFSRLHFPDGSGVFLLSPVAVRTAYQGREVGQAVIARGLQEMKERGVRTVVTYGDPAFYAKVGFEPVSVETIPSPFKLSQPEGWLAQSLTQDPIEPLPGPGSCVEAFQKRSYW